MNILSSLTAASWEVILELAPWLLFGTLIAGVLHVLLPRHLVRGSLQGPWGVVKAVLVGVPMPLCSCGVIPAGLGLRRDGASRGASLGFLISTPQTGVDSILVSASFLGLPFALFKVAAAGVMGVVGGLVADHVSAPELAVADDEDAEAPRRVWYVELADHSLDLLRTIWGWLVLGIVVSAIINVVVPDSWLQSLGAWGALGAGVAALLVSLPMYVCATASVPIAAALVAGGMPAGAALVFLMAGPATNVATLGAVYRGFGARILAVYLATLILGSLGAALVFESVLPAQTALASHEHHTASWWAMTTAVALLVLLAAFALSDLRHFLRRYTASASEAPEMDLRVQGMTCDGCAKRVEGALYAVDGVESVSIERDRGLVHVRSRTRADQLCAAVEKAGYVAALN